MQEPKVVHQVGAYPGFSVMKRLSRSIFPPPPPWDWMQVYRRVSPNIKLHLGGESHCESNVCCPRIQCNVSS